LFILIFLIINVEFKNFNKIIFYKLIFIFKFVKIINLIQKSIKIDNLKYCYIFSHIKG